MNTLEYISEQFQHLQSGKENNVLHAMEKNAFNDFNRMGIPTARHEEWKYTRVGSLFNKEYIFPGEKAIGAVTKKELDAVRLPGSAQASELVFINGFYSPGLSVIRSAALEVMSLGDAAQNEYSDIVAGNLGHSSKYVKDGIHALNTAFMHGGVFVHVKKGKVVEHPVYFYHFTDARAGNIFSQPRALVHVAEHAQVQLVETYATIGIAGSFTNQVLEVTVESGALVEYYKIQNDAVHSSQVSTTHFRQTGKSIVHAVTVSLNGGMIRNNLNIALEAERSESHLYGLYFVKGNTHVDNHTVVDNVKPNCLSNELYKGILDENAAAVFNGKIYVQQDAQKTNAFQSNKNILLSDTASVNTKPQLEIFADDVKCSHGCTVGQLDEEGMFYLRSRGLSEKVARSMLVHAFAIDVLDHIKPVPIRNYVDELVSIRLGFDKE